MAAHYGWKRGDTANYHREANGPVSVRDCVLLEDPFYVGAWRAWFVLLDRVAGPVPFVQISAPQQDGTHYSQQSLLPDLLPDYLHSPLPATDTAWRPPPTGAQPPADPGATPRHSPTDRPT